MVLATTETNLQIYLASMQQPPRRHAWDEASKHIAPGQLFFATTNTWMIQRLEPLRTQPGGPGTTLGLFAPLWTQASAHALSVDLSKGIKLDAAAVSGNETDGQRVAATVSALVTLGQNALSQMQAQARTPAPAGTPAATMATVLGPLLTLAEPLLANARVEHHDNITRLSAEVATAPR